MFGLFSENDTYIRHSALRASIESALAADPLCRDADITLSFLSYAVVMEGLAKSDAATRALEIVTDMVRPTPVLDRMVWSRAT